MKKPFILVCKPGSHQTLCEWVDDFERLGKVENIIINESKGKKKVKNTTVLSTQLLYGIRMMLYL
jgi:hypothetical protein